MATDENKTKNVVRDEWTSCTFRVERGPSEGRAGGMADILTKAFAGHGEDHWFNVVTSRAGGAFAEVFFRRPSHFYELRARLSRYGRVRPSQLWEASLESDVLGVLAVISFEW